MDFSVEDLRWFVPQMMGAVRQTKRTGKEHGFNVCKVGDQLKETRMCVGDKCSVEIPRCEWPDTFMEFHTHPTSMAVPSPDDVYGYIANDTDYACMGLPKKDGHIRCFKIQKEHPNVRKFIDAYKTQDRLGMLRLMDAVIDIAHPVKQWKNFIKSGGL